MNIIRDVGLNGNDWREVLADRLFGDVAEAMGAGQAPEDLPDDLKPWWMVTVERQDCIIAAPAGGDPAGDPSRWLAPCPMPAVLHAHRIVDGFVVVDWPWDGSQFTVPEELEWPDSDGEGWDW